MSTSEEVNQVATLSERVNQFNRAIRRIVRALDIGEACGGVDTDDNGGHTAEVIERHALALRAQLAALQIKNQWHPISTAPRDGTAILAYGRHTHSPADAQQGVKAGDHWWAILVWDIWRKSDPAGWGEQQKWVFAKDGSPAWSYPDLWKPLLVPAEGKQSLRNDIYLADKHQGMKISAEGILGRIRDGRYYPGLDFGCGEMLHHLKQTASRFYAGDIRAVDVFLQIYDLADDRPEEGK